MSTTDHAATDRRVSDLAVELERAEFVRFLASPDGDALAATGVLARVLSIPYQARVVRTDTAGASEADLTVAVGRTEGDVSITDRPVAARAVEVAQALSDGTAELPPPIRALALAGIIAAEREIDDHADVFEDSLTIDSRPGVGVPTADPVDGLAHTTLVHAPFSGDIDATSDALSGIDADAGGTETRVQTASMLAVSVVDEPNTRASTAIERALHPHVVESSEGCPFATLAGYADVLDALGRSSPGEGLALALGHGSSENALACWRDHARTVHDAVRTAELDRYPGCVVADLTGAPTPAVETVARLVREYRSPEPVVLATADSVAVATARARDRDLTAPLAAAVSAAEDDGTVTGRGRYARASIAPQGTDVDAFREAI